MTDEAAWRQAIEMYRARGRGDAAYINEKLEREGFRSAGEFASYGCQFRALNVEPWRTVPCSLIEPVDVVLARGPDSGDPGDDFAAAKLAKRLLDAGISIWAPDPERSLREAVREPAA
jgi:hypothetical protein